MKLSVPIRTVAGETFNSTEEMIKYGDQFIAGVGMNIEVYCEEIQTKAQAYLIGKGFASTWKVEGSE